MTDLERFTETMAKMMGKCLHETIGGQTGNLPAYYVCKKCGEYFCDSWSPIIEGELTPEVRKWWAENLPETWELRLAELMYEYIPKYALEYILSAENLWKWMRENESSWNRRLCMNTDCRIKGIIPVECSERNTECGGTGKVPRWDVGESMEVDIAEEK